FIGTQTALMESDIVASRTRSRLLATNPAWQSNVVHLKVSVVPRATIFKLRGTGDSPEYTKAYVQTCMEEYSKLKKDMIEQTSDTSVAGMAAEVTRLEKEMKKRGETMANFQGTNDI